MVMVLLSNLPCHHVIKPFGTIRFSKIALFLKLFLQLQTPVAPLVLTQKTSTWALIDRKFTVDNENGVNFEIEGARFRDIIQYVNLGKTGHRCPRGAERDRLQS